MDLMAKRKNQAVSDHYQKNWSNAYEERQWSEGPMSKMENEFRVLEFPPNNHRKFWTYATSGMSFDGGPIELHLFSKEPNEANVELLTIVAHYHIYSKPLGLHHTVNIGRPWIPDSQCTYGFISLPYLDGPNLEKGIILDQPTSFYWLIPITKQERAHKVRHGVESLEDRFEQSNFDYLNPLRQSVV